MFCVYAFHKNKINLFYAEMSATRPHAPALLAWARLYITENQFLGALLKWWTKWKIYIRLTLYQIRKYLWLFICCKTKFKKIFFFWKNICFLQNIHYLQNEMFLYGKKFYNENFFYWKKHFFTEKNINENVKNIHLISEIYFYPENVCVL